MASQVRCWALPANISVAVEHPTSFALNDIGRRSAAHDASALGSTADSFQRSVMAEVDPNRTQCRCATLILHGSSMYTDAACAPQHSAPYNTTRRNGRFAAETCLFLFGAMGQQRLTMQSCHETYIFRLENIALVSRHQLLHPAEWRSGRAVI